MSLSFDSAFGGFRDDQIREFLKDKELISSQEHFFVRNDIPYLTFVLKYFPHRAEADPKLNPKGERNEAWRSLLSEKDMGLFNLLRDWRSKRARKEGLPPYILLTNQQLAVVVKKRPQSISELMQIDGIGKAKAEKYGQDILEISKINIPSETETQVQSETANESDSPITN